MYSFSGNSGNQIWETAVSNLISDNIPFQPGRIEQTKELLHVAFTINNPRQRWVTSRHPAVNPAFAISEVIWILNGSNEASFLNSWNSQLSKFAGNDDHYHGAYGYRLRRNFGIDQLKRAYQALKNNPASRQIVLQIWDSKIDFPNIDGTPVASDIPCNICALPKIRDNRLEWLQIMRSNDVQRGLPYNIVQFTCLQEVLAGWLGIEVGSYNQISDSLHVYEGDLLDIRQSSQIQEEKNCDSLCVSYDESQSIIQKMYTLIAEMASQELLPDRLLSIITGTKLPTAYKNLLLIVAAESARRKRWQEITIKAISECSNPALVQVWHNWASRFKTKIS